MSGPRAIALCAAGLLAFGCRSGEPSLRFFEPPAPAQIAVEVFGGFREPIPAAPPSERVELLVDVTSSMDAKTKAGIRRFEAARLGAARLVRDLPESASFRLSAIGVRSGKCRSASALANTDAGAPRSELLGVIGALRPKGEGSLAKTLEALASKIEREDTPRRVVAFTDLGDECGGNLCGASAALAAAGGRLDVVVVGDARAPRCIAKPDFEDVPGGPDRADTRAPRYRVETVWVGSSLRARGLADGKPIDLRPGPGMLRIDLEPIAFIGPIHFPPAAITRVRVLDFPHLEEKVLEWYWETVPVEPEKERS